MWLGSSRACTRYWPDRLLRAAYALLISSVPASVWAYARQRGGVRPSAIIELPLDDRNRAWSPSPASRSPGGSGQPADAKTGPKPSPPSSE